MTALAVLLSILAAISIGAMSPGPSFVLVSRISIASSRTHGLASAFCLRARNGQRPGENHADTPLHAGQTGLVPTRSTPKTRADLVPEAWAPRWLA
jgi:hypothetical protein